MRELFRGSWALVTGASSGIGEELARQLARRGANLIITARSRDRLEALAAELREREQLRVEVVVADLATPGGVERLRREVDALDVFVEHLINNAGFGLAGAFAASDVRVDLDMVRLNCEAPMVLARHFAPSMAAQRRGGILNVASTAAHQPMPYMAVYGATKAFLMSWSVALGEELRSRGVRVCALCPGPVPTRFQEVAGTVLGFQSIAALSAEETARRGLEGYERGREVVVTGAVNTVQTLTSKVLPRAVVTRSLGFAMKRMGRND